MDLTLRGARERVLVVRKHGSSGHRKTLGLCAVSAPESKVLREEAHCFTDPKVRAGRGSITIGYFNRTLYSSFFAKDEDTLFDNPATPG